MKFGLPQSDACLSVSSSVCPSLSHTHAHTRTQLPIVYGASEQWRNVFTLGSGRRWAVTTHPSTPNVVCYTPLGFNSQPMPVV